jgi:hypothetical protein
VWLRASLAIALTPVAAAAPDAACKVQLSRGWSTHSGTGTITMRNVGKPCGDALHTVPEASIPVDSITVEVAPQKGTVKIEVPKFLYTPQAGFVGRDRFTLFAAGPDRNRQLRVTLKGEIIVQVEP